MMLQRVSLALIVEAGGTASYGTAQVKKEDIYFPCSPYAKLS